MAPDSDKSCRERMEASENMGLPQEGCGGTDLHRIDPHRVSELLRSDEQADGFARLDLMVSTILPRLVRDAGDRA
jgi:hypothetical protein